MSNINTHTYTCNTCGSTKEIYILPNENPEELEGCVCDRSIDKMKFSEEKILEKLIKKSNK